MSQPATVLCPECEGEGYFIYVGGPGYFSATLGTYLPEEYPIACERCRGYGEIELEPEPRETPDSDDDFADDEELPF